MNMREPSTAWDRRVTDAELAKHCGQQKSSSVRDLIVETITETIRKISYKALSVPFVSYRRTDYGVLRAYPLVEVVTDYGTDKGPVLTALMDVLEGSSCPFVATYRKALADKFADSWADEVEGLSE